MTQMNPARERAIERVVNMVALAMLERQLSTSEALFIFSVAQRSPKEALSFFAAAMRSPEDETARPRERVAGARQSHRASVVTELVRLKQEGRGRKAVGDLVRENALDPDDKKEAKRLKDKYRRWLRAENRKRACARLPRKHGCINES
jgi:hypothetical protein